MTKEAKTYRGDIKKGLRMERKDLAAIRVSERASDAKKARKEEKGRTMRGTSYFNMAQLNKTVPLKETKESKKQAGTTRYSK
jgi:hypothetical protein